MKRQSGITTVELLVSIGLIASAAGFTLTMATEVEKEALNYQSQHQTNVKDMMKKIRGTHKNKTQNEQE